MQHQDKEWNRSHARRLPKHPGSYPPYSKRRYSRADRATIFLGRSSKWVAELLRVDIPPRFCAPSNSATLPYQSISVSPAQRLLIAPFSKAVANQAMFWL